MALLEHDPTIYQEEVAALLGISRTELRRRFQLLAENYGDKEPNLKDRIKKIRKKVLSERLLHQGRARSVLTPLDIRRIIIIRENVPRLTWNEIARIFGVSKSAVYRGMEKYGAGLFSSSDDVRAKDTGARFNLAKSHIPAANTVLKSFSIPNDLTEEHRDLFVSLLRSVEELENQVAQISNDLVLSKKKINLLSKQLDQALPLWKHAWETFVLKSAEGAGMTVGRGAIFAAGFVAGLLYKTFGH